MTSTILYILDENKNVKAASSEEEFLEAHTSPNYRVNYTMAGRNTVVSTVFLGIDHGFSDEEKRPVVFETLVFSDKKRLDGYTRRCCTWEEAEKQHNQTVFFVKETLAGEKETSFYA